MSPDAGPLKRTRTSTLSWRFSTSAETVTNTFTLFVLRPSGTQGLLRPNPPMNDNLPPRSSLPLSPSLPYVAIGVATRIANVITNIAAAFTVDFVIRSSFCFNEEQQQASRDRRR